jgi:hypothetical protein
MVKTSTLTRYRVWVSESKGNVGPEEPYEPYDFSEEIAAKNFCKHNNGPVSHAYMERLFDHEIMEEDDELVSKDNSAGS